MSKLIGGLVGRLGLDNLRRKKILHYVDLPSLIVVDDLEVAIELGREYLPTELLVVHSPNALQGNGYNGHRFSLNGKEWYNGFFFEGKDLSRAMPLLYEQRGEDDIQAELESLEAALDQELARREENQLRLQGVAERFADAADQNPRNLLSFIYEILTKQFEHPEHFIRELLQNSAAATKTFANGRIDVYVDPEARTVRVDDNGTGMSREVMEDVYFNLFKSLNEYLEHAAGKFGMGAVSGYGLGHRLVTVDSRPQEGEGGLAVVDSELRRDDFLPSKRGSQGTSVEINLSQDSVVDYNRVVEILMQDCSYISTPIYLHRNGAVERINKPLIPETSDTITFNDRIQGHLRRGERGLVDILSHEIRLTSIETEGIEGAVNCNELETLWSRDGVVEDSVFKYVLARIKQGSRKVRHDGATDLSNSSLTARLTDYRDFIYQTLLNPDGSANSQWISDNLGHIRSTISHVHGNKEFYYGEKEFFDDFGNLVLESIKKIGDVYGSLVSKVFSVLPKLRNYDSRDVKESAIKVTAGLAEITASASVISGFGFMIYAAVTHNDGLALIGALQSYIPISAIVVYVIEGSLEAIVKKSIRTIKHRYEKGIVDYHNKSLFQDYNPATTDRGSFRTAALVSAGIGAVGGALYGLGNLLTGVIDHFSSQEATDIAEIAKDPETMSQIAEGFQFASLTPYFAIALGATVAIGLTSRYLKHKGVLKPYEGQLSTDQQQLLEDVRKQMDPELFGDVQIYYSSGLTDSGPRFVTGNGKLAINQHKQFPPWAAAVGYAVDVLKNPELAGQITNKNLGVKA